MQAILIIKYIYLIFNLDKNYQKNSFKDIKKMFYAYYLKQMELFYIVDQKIIQLKYGMHK